MAYPNVIKTGSEERSKKKTKKKRAKESVDTVVLLLVSTPNKRHSTFQRDQKSDCEQLFSILVLN